MWSEGTGELSKQLCGRVLHSTVQDLSSLRPEAAELAGRVHAESRVFDLAGVRAKISTALKSGAVTLKQNQVILWHKDGASFAGKALFFAQMEGDLVVIYECFRELASAVPFTKIFHITGEKGAVLLSNMEHIAHPTWWAVDAQTVTCLL